MRSTFRKRGEAASQDTVRCLASALGISETFARLLAGRGHTEVEETRRFLNPSRDQLGPVQLLPDIAPAVDRIRKAIEDGEYITVFGDYDTDGICAVCVLSTVLDGMGAKHSYYIPDRHTEGYGLNEDALRDIAASGTTLIITVDCGISAVEEAKLCDALGMDLIITDHHECPDELPRALAVIDPKRPDSPYPFRELCGTGVAYRVACALAGEEAAESTLDLVTLATVTDIVPLTGENRVLYHAGIGAIREGKRLGLSALIRAAGIEPAQMDSTRIGFQIGPRINAAGRVDLPHKCVDLFLTQDAAMAERIAEDLNRDNDRRKQVCASIEQAARTQMRENCDLSRDPGVVVAGEDWEVGVQGIVAGHLAGVTHRPTIVMTRVGDNYVGSARSVAGISIYDVLDRCRETLDHFGGHAMAAGLTVPAGRLEAFRKKFSEELCREDPILYLPFEEYDLDVELSEVTQSLVEELKLLQPTGAGNPSPILRSRALYGMPRRIGKNYEHFKATLQPPDHGSSGIDAVAFRMQPPPETWTGAIDTLFVPELNVWRGTCSVQCQIKAYGREYACPQDMADDQPDTVWTRCRVSQYLLASDKAAEVPVTDDMPLPMGTLYLKHTPQGLPSAFVGGMEAVCPDETTYGINCLLLAPDYAALAGGGTRWRKLILLDAPEVPEAAFELAKRLHCDAIGGIMCGNSFSAPLMPGFGTDILRTYFVALRNLLRQGGFFFDAPSALAEAARVWALDKDRAELILTVFGQMGLVLWTEKAPYLALTDAKKAVPEDSALFKKLTHQ